jgi:hypothetical protein
MRFLVMVKASPESEAGQLPSTEIIGEMQAYNEELVKNGVMLAGEGLHPSSKGARIDYAGSKRSVTDGPFAEAKELVAGFWLIQARSLEEAIEWLKRAPFQEGQVEIRQIFETEDFAEVLTPEQREREEQLRAQVAERGK